MGSSLGGKLEEVLNERVHAREPDFSSVKSYVALGDKVIGDAPDIIGKLLGTKQDIREENKNPAISESQRELNLLYLIKLDIDLKLQLWANAPDEASAAHVAVCMLGRLFIRRKHLVRAA